MLSVTKPLNKIYPIIALHGFLGSPKDFSILGLNNIYAPYIFNTQITTLKNWCHRFAKNINKPSIIMGYSMGGRLALNMLVYYPDKFKAAIIIAAHPGISNFDLAYTRTQEDFIKARWFSDYSFEDALNKWHSLEVLKDSPKPTRFKNDFCSNTLSLALKRFSLGRQDYLPPLINNLDIPILWLYPQKEAANSKDINLKHSLSRLINIGDYPHRLLHCASRMLKKEINNFLDTI